MRASARVPTAPAGGFLIAEVNGRLAGCLSAVSYSGRFGFIGLYIVVPEWRGQGIGWRLWTQGMQRLAASLRPATAGG